MRISDWSSDVCSSDLLSRDGSGTHGATGIGSCDRRPAPPREPPFRRDLRSRANRLSSPAMTNQIDYVLEDALPEPGTAGAVADGGRWEIGRAAGRERGGQDVWISVVAVASKKK